MHVHIKGPILVTCGNGVEHVWHLDHGTLITARSPSGAIGAAENFFHWQRVSDAAQLATWIIDWAFPDWVDPCRSSHGGEG